MVIVSSSIFYTFLSFSGRLRRNEPTSASIEIVGHSSDESSVSVPPEEPVVTVSTQCSSDLSGDVIVIDSQSCLEFCMVSKADGTLIVLTFEKFIILVFCYSVSS
jgi:hypothetical protein